MLVKAHREQKKPARSEEGKKKNYIRPEANGDQQVIFGPEPRASKKRPPVMVEVKRACAQRVTGCSWAFSVRRSIAAGEKPAHAPWGEASPKKRGR